MRRRDFIAAISGAAAAWPLAARAQPAGKLPTIGFFGAQTASALRPWVDAFLQRLREHGWVEGRTVAIEYRWADGHFDRSRQIAAELVRLKVDVIVTHATANILAVKQETQSIPIVFASAGDPVGSGLVASLSRPGGNVTGLSVLAPDVAGKRLQLAREVVPNLRRLATLANAGNPVTASEIGEVEAAARVLGIEIVRSDIRGGEDIAPAIEALKGRADALYVQVDALMGSHRVQINTLALGARLPTLHGERLYVEAGGLLAFGPSIQDSFRHAADYVDKILHGAKPADLPVEQPTKFDLIINLSTAKALGLKIPEAFLLRADEVIE